jgi:DNA-binding response OmpR family regulator
VLVLSARSTMEDTISGLDVGADDYLIKPFRLPELVARARALIRRSNAVADSCLRHGALLLDTAVHSATLGGQPLELTPREWAILEILLLASPNVVNKDRLVQGLAGWDKDITPNAVEVHVSRLRAKLGVGGIEIRTVRGIGYRLDEPVATE